MAEVELVFVALRQPSWVVQELTESLDADELNRASEMPDGAARAEFAVAHGVLRAVLAERLQVPPAVLGWRYGPHGKPELAWPVSSLSVSLSHSGSVAAVALASGRAVGVDLQHQVAEVAVGRMARRYYPADEAAWVAAGSTPAERLTRYTQLWTRKEACVKVGGGQLIPALLWPTHGQSPVLVAGAAGHCLVRDVPAPVGYHAAVALAGPDDFTVRHRSWRHDRSESSDNHDPLAVQQ